MEAVADVNVCEGRTGYWAVNNEMMLFDRAAGRSTDRAEGSSHDLAYVEASIVGLLWRRRYTFAACVAACLLLGVLYVWLAPPRYTSSALLYVQAEANAPHPAGAPEPMLVQATAQAHADLLTSNTVLNAALADPAVRGSQTLADVDEPLPWLRENLVVVAGERDRVISVALTTGDADESALIVNRVVEAYLQQLRRQRQASVQTMLDRLRQDSTEPIAVATPDAPTVDAAFADTLTNDPQLVAERLQALSQRLTEAELAASQAAALVASSQSVEDPAALGQLLAAAGIEPVASSATQQADIALMQAVVERERQRLGHLGDRHPAIVALDRQADSLQRRLAETRQATMDAMRLRLREHLNAMVQREAHVRAALAAQQRIAARLDTIPVTLIDPAQPARRPSAPQPKRALALALVLGVILGGSVVLWQDHHDQLRRGPGRRSTSLTIREADDVELADREVPLLGVVPQTQATEDEPPAWDAAASSIHHLRAVLQVRARNLGHKTFAVTSPRRGSGKTSIAIGLASSLAMSGTRAIVIDLDLASRIAPPSPDGEGPALPLDELFRRQGLGGNGHRDDGGAGRHRLGVTAMMRGASLKECVTRSSMPGLSLLPAGAVGPDDIAGMSDSFIQRLLAEAAADHDIVLIDTGPVPGSVEALLVASRVDGVLVVAHQGESRRQFERSLSYLRVVGAKLAGTIFNGYAAGAPAPESEAPQAAGLIPHVRQRGPKTPENLGSGLLAAAVFQARGGATDAAAGDAAADDEVSADDLGDLVSVLGDVPAGAGGDRGADAGGTGGKRV